MTRFTSTALVALSLVAASGAASAHAFLERAVPSVGSTTQSAPGELELTFTEGVVPAFSGVTVTDERGVSVAVGKAILDPSRPTMLHVKLNHGLKPGVYVVRWHVVAVDTHATSGSYRFTLAP